MRLVPASSAHLECLRRWFPDAGSARQWGGPQLRFPFERDAFLEDISWGRVPSWSWVSEHGELLGFGQYYSCHGYCRLARLVVAPQARGRGEGRRMTAALMQTGRAELGVDRCCLFVLESNAAAIACYRSLGFVEAAYPGWQERLPGVRFMAQDPDRS